VAEEGVDEGVFIRPGARRVVLLQTQRLLDRNVADVTALDPNLALRPVVVEAPLVPSRSVRALPLSQSLQTSRALVRLLPRPPLVLERCLPGLGLPRTLGLGRKGRLSCSFGATAAGEVVLDLLRANVEIAGERGFERGGRMEAMLGDEGVDDETRCRRKRLAGEYRLEGRRVTQVDRRFPGMKTERAGRSSAVVLLGPASRSARDGVTRKPRAAQLNRSSPDGHRRRRDDQQLTCKEATG
jgi:hypothetical protein